LLLPKPKKPVIASTAHTEKFVTGKTSLKTLLAFDFFVIYLIGKILKDPGIW